MARFTRISVADRAGGLCEYCQLPAAESVLPHTVDHIRARKHRGPTTLQNTAWACAPCNGAKGSDATSYDPETEELVRLFNPRLDRWKDHFLWDGPVLRGKTSIGRATIVLLRINDPARIEHRRLLMAAGLYPKT
jgi:hypothetical protein